MLNEEQQKLCKLWKPLAFGDKRDCYLRIDHVATLLGVSEEDIAQVYQELVAYKGYIWADQEGQNASNSPLPYYKLYFNYESVEYLANHFSELMGLLHQEYESAYHWAFCGY